MNSNFHYNIDLNEDQNHQSFFSPLGSSLHHHQHLHLQAPYNPSSSLSYLPFLKNSHQIQDQEHVGYINNFDGFLDNPHLSQSLETKKFVSNGESSSNDQMVPKKETIHQEQFNLPQYPTKVKTEPNSFKWVSSKVRLMMKKKTTMKTTTDFNKEQFLNLSNLEEDNLKKLSTNMIRVCSDCNTTKTPLWRSGPRGPKSLCNACGIRQRKARRAAMAASAGATTSELSPPLLKNIQKKRSNGVCNLSSTPKVKKCKKTIMSETAMEAETAGDLKTQSKSTVSSYSDDLAIILSKSSAYQKVLPQDEKEAAILLMALSYGKVYK